MNSLPDSPISDALHVVAAVVVDVAGRVLLARRPEHVHQGGLWEFPGGKVEAGETALQALVRELHEEVAIEVESARPLIRIHHRYPDKTVLLDVWRVKRYTGSAHGREGQPVAWVAPRELPSYAVPAANRPIVAAARLPEHYLITPEPGDEARFLAGVRRAFEGGIRLVQLRAKSLPSEQYRRLAAAVIALGREYEAAVLLNAPAEWVRELGAAGMQLTGQGLHALSTRPLPAEYWVAASCHTPEDLQQAERIGADFALLSPVLATASHPETLPLGWKAFSAWVESAAVPVYALGGLGGEDTPVAQAHGAQGVAAISGLWPAEA